MKLRPIARALGILVLLVVVVPFVIYAVPGVIGADQSFIILSGSMEPAMSPGDAVVVTEVDPESIQEGDVITYAKQGSSTVVTHRVVGIDEINGQLVFETKGDANEAADREPVPASNLIGKVTLTIPLIGYVIDFVNTPIGFVATVLLPLGLLVLTEAWTVAKQAVGDGDDGDDAEDSDGDDAPNGDGADPEGGEDGESRLDDGSVFDADDPAAAMGLEAGAIQPGATAVSDLPALLDAPASARADADLDEARADADRDGAIADASRGESIADGGETMAPAADPDVLSVAVAPRDLLLTFFLLVVLTPYVAFVALELRTFLSIAVAYAIGFTAVAFTVLQAAAWHQRLARRRAERSATSDEDRTGGEPIDFDVEEVLGSTDAQPGDDEHRGRAS